MNMKETQKVDMAEKSKRSKVAKILVGILVGVSCFGSCTVMASPYKICDDFNNYMKINAPDVFDDNEFFDQGINSFGYHGTCSEASEANVMNLLFGTDYTEQDFVDLAIRLNLCTTGQENQYVNGGQTPIQMVNILQYMGGTTGFPVMTKCLVKNELPNVENCAMLLDRGVGIIMAVDSNILWGFTPEECAAAGVDYFTSDHWIVVKNAVYESGNSIPYSRTVSRNIAKNTVSSETISSNTNSENNMVSVNKAVLLRQKSEISINKGISNKKMDRVLTRKPKEESSVSNNHLGRGKLVGFDIIDSSGSGVSYVDVGTFQAMIFGPTGTEIPYCACVLIAESKE